MRRQLFPLILFFVCLGFVSCDKSDIAHESDFEKSYDEWLQFKLSCGNSYTYVVYNSSWVGASWETIFTVREGRVVRRQFNFISTMGLGNVPEEALNWIEEEGEINSHEYSGGATVRTLDEIYELARTQWLLKRSNAKTYFESKNNGMLSLCGYVEDGCQDDCFTGIHISSISSKAD